MIKINKRTISNILNYLFNKKEILPDIFMDFYKTILLAVRDR